MPIDIRYTSRRSEVWAWYWKSWRSRLWRMHLAFTLTICALAFVLRGSVPPVIAMASGLGASALLVGAMAIFPQIMFKAQERTLVVDEQGVRTTVGPRSGSISWAEISGVSDERGCVVITTTMGNAFIVPPRAFASEDDRLNFLNLVREAKTCASTARA